MIMAGYDHGLGGVLLLDTFCTLTVTLQKSLDKNVLAAKL